MKKWKNTGSAQLWVSVAQAAGDERAAGKFLDCDGGWPISAEARVQKIKILQLALIDFYCLNLQGK